MSFSRVHDRTVSIYESCAVLALLLTTSALCYQTTLGANDNVTVLQPTSKTSISTTASTTASPNLSPGERTTEIAPAQKTAETPVASSSRFETDYEIDPYYSSFDLIYNFTREPVPDVDEENELIVYRDLLFKSLKPRFALIEVSINPLPTLGTIVRDRATDLYGRANITGSLNLVGAVTKGFDEPFAVSLFFGNMVKFASPVTKTGTNKGFVGFLLSVGNYHIKDNLLIDDTWFELEWKIKGDWEGPKHAMHWSFRIGTKVHDSDDIPNVGYFSLRRSRSDYDGSAFSIFKNSGFEYTVDFSLKRRNPVRHYFFVEKKWPLPSIKRSFSLSMGFVWEDSSRYLGSLAPDDTFKNLTYILRPNFVF